MGDLCCKPHGSSQTGSMWPEDNGKMCTRTHACWCKRTGVLRPGAQRTPSPCWPQLIIGHHARPRPAAATSARRRPGPHHQQGGAGRSSSGHAGTPGMARGGALGALPPPHLWNPLTQPGQVRSAALHPLYRIPALRYRAGRVGDAPAPAPPPGHPHTHRAHLHLRPTPRPEWATRPSYEGLCLKQVTN